MIFGKLWPRDFDRGRVASKGFYLFFSLRCTCSQYVFVVAVIYDRRRFDVSVKYADISIFEELMDPRLEIFDMEFTNTEFTQFSLAVVLIRVVEFR